MDEDVKYFMALANEVAKQTGVNAERLLEKIMDDEYLFETIENEIFYLAEELKND